MDFILGILLGTRLLTGLTSGLSGASSPVHFAPPQIILTSTEIQMRCRLVDAFSPDLKKLSETSAPILLYLIAELRALPSDKIVARTTVESRLLYDIIEKNYRVAKTCTADTTTFRSADSAFMAATSFDRIRLCGLDSIEPGTSYYFTASSVLGNTVIEALHNRTIDLMYYWEYKRPSFRTERYAGTQLTVNRRHTAKDHPSGEGIP